jgi:ubiquinone/menaquinone biosynthesis C-methylase UbiE
MSDPLGQLAYQTLQQGRSLAGLAHKEISSRLMAWLAPEAKANVVPLAPGVIAELRKSMESLLELDWHEAQQGLYPSQLLFDGPWLDWFLRYPLVWLDQPAIWSRRSRRDVRDLPRDVNPGQFPDYYLQNFHHQTDGYLSDRSAELYDLQVEILFNGTADAMRRRLLQPLLTALPHRGPAQPPRILDLATGTGRTLRQLRGALPDAQLLGIDLSSAYLRQASRWLAQLPGELPQLIQANAEALPFAAGCMQAVTCVFLLHELPGDARQACLNEAFRVLEPGGVLVLADSVQLADSPQFSGAMENFRRLFHEPYYRDYISDNIPARLGEAGFVSIHGQSHFMTRVWSARKPMAEAS